MRELSRRQLLLTAAAVIALTTAAVGIYGLITGPRHQTPSAPTRGTVTVASVGPAAAATPSAAAQPAQALPKTIDPISYGRAVADALFDWDTASGYLPSDYTAAVLADADPSGEETAGLITDVATYLPTNEQWLNLAAMHVAQTITIHASSVPADWGSILQQDHGQIRPGTTAVTIIGTRHRTGTWNGTPAATATPVSFTIFIACPPAFDRCHTLRLSQLNDPLK